MLSGPTAVCPTHGPATIDSDPFVGRSIAEYRLFERTRTERAGVWYLSKRTGHDKFCEVLVPYADIGLDPAVASAATTEATRARELIDKRIGRLLGSGRTPSSLPYLVADYTEGVRLSERLKDGPTIGTAEAVVLIRRICAALVAAEAWELLHLGLAPDAIVLESDHVIVTGFGASALRAASPNRSNAPYIEPDTSGAPSFSTDAYALGAIAHHILFGAPPESASVARCGDHVLDELVPRLLAASRNLRPTSIEEVMDILGRSPHANITGDLTVDPASSNTYVMSGREIDSERVVAAPSGVVPQPLDRRDTNLIEVTAKMEAPKVDQRRLATRIIRTRDVKPPAARPIVESPEPSEDLPVVDDDELVLVADNSGRWIFGAIAVVLVFVAAGVYFVTGMDTEATIVTALPTTTAAPPAPPTRTELTVAAAPPKPPPRPAPPLDTVTLRIRSSPTGAAVHRADDDVLLGKTPLEIQLDRRPEDLEFILRLDGFVPAKGALSATNDGLALVDLEAIPPPPPPPPRRTARRRRKKPKPLGRGTLLDPFAE